MKHFVLINIIVALGVLSLQEQDTTAVRKYKPVNNYSGLNSLMKRLANPSWDGGLPDLGTGLKLEPRGISPLGKADWRSLDNVPITSSGSYAGENTVEPNPFLDKIGKGVAPVGSPVYVFFRLAGTYVTDSPQLLNIHAAADLAAAENLRVRITGAADSATGSPEKNAELALSRAEHVANIFKERGVPEERIEVQSEGGITDYEPVSANRNCRIELFVQ